MLIENKNIYKYNFIYSNSKSYTYYIDTKSHHLNLQIKVDDTNLNKYVKFLTYNIQI